MTNNTSIYDQHDAAFRGVSAYVITDKTGRQVGKVAFSFARSGLRTTCYFHIHGTQMARAYAQGGGYDKASAAAQAAVCKIKAMREEPCFELVVAMASAIKDQGASWDRDLRDAGFNVLQAV